LLFQEDGSMPDVTITPSENGPYIVSGQVRLTDIDGRAIEHRDPIAMCRCGHSANKPFCDGTHATIDFDGTLAN
jgi:CDGSH-type Zn-finger protein